MRAKMSINPGTIASVFHPPSFMGLVRWGRRGLIVFSVTTKDLRKLQVRDEQRQQGNADDDAEGRQRDGKPAWNQ